MTLMLDIKSKYRTWKENRFLKKHGCKTREEYDRYYDPDHVPRATQIKNFYQGYKHIHCFDNHSSDIYKIIYDYGPGGYRDGFDDVYDWCKEHLQGKWRYDCHRVINCPATAWQWEINEIGGHDIWFFAFQDDEDYFIFKLQWGQ